VTAPAQTWDLSFLRVGALVTGAVALVGALVTGLLAGWDDAAGVLVGAAIVTAFFCVSGIVVAWAGRIQDSSTLPAALGTFFVKAVVLYGLLTALPDHGWLDRRRSTTRSRRRTAKSPGNTADRVRIDGRERPRQGGSSASTCGPGTRQ
jgi:hypothetical protein